MAPSPSSETADSDTADAEHTAHLLGVDDDTIHMAVGEELARVRYSLGWTRATLMSRLLDELGVEIKLNTYSCYEQGIRPCPIPRLVLFCRAMGVDAAEVLGLALQRAQVNMHNCGVRLDLRMVLTEKAAGKKLMFLQRWARNRLYETGDGVARMEWAVLQEFAVLLGVSGKQLTDWLLRFTPEVAPQRTRPVGERADR